MTCEIVIMNKNGIAMAADSTITKTSPHLNPHFQTKLFQFSYQHQVAIMLHDRMQFNHVPVETIIKMYQDHIKNDHLTDLTDYAAGLVNFIQNHKDIFAHEKTGLSWVYDALSYLNRLGHEIYNSWQENIKTRQDSLGLKNYTQTYLSKKIEQVSAQQSCFLHDKTDLRQIILNEFQKFGEYYIENSLNLFPLCAKTRALIYELLYQKTIKEDFDMGQTGVVLCGFGKDCLFPGALHLKLGGVYFNELKYSIMPTQKINNANQAQIIPYAITDTISSFIKGVHPLYENFSLHEFKNSLKRFAGKFTGDDADFEMIESDINREYETYRQNIKHHVLTQHVQPMIDSIKFLPSTDLAFIAETLVGISSLHTSVMPGQNTIGGYINVATITKGDGFQWIKNSGGPVSYERNITRLA